MTKYELLQRLRDATPQLSVGVLTADLMNLGSQIKLLQDAGVELLHVDVMDGRIWPKITVGSPFVQSLKTPLLKDVHLLIEESEKQLADFVKAGADILTFSVESCQDVASALANFRQTPRAEEVLVGLSLNPLTPPNTINPFACELDLVVLLAVGPDTGSSNFIADLPERIAQVRQINPDLLIFVDGAIKRDNIAQVAAMAPDVIVTGSAVFDGKTPAQNLDSMLQAIR